MRGMQASRQQRTTAKADSAAEHRRLLRCFTRTIRAGETAQQTVGAGVAYAANARVRRSSQQSQEAGQCEEQECDSLTDSELHGVVTHTLGPLGNGCVY